MAEIPFKSWTEYFEQREIWLSADGPIRIVDMGARYRANAARWALRKAHYFETAQAFEALAVAPPEDSAAADDFDAAMDLRAADPEQWLRETPLYRALVGQEEEDHDD